MVSNLLIVAAAAVLSAALRTYHHILLRRLGTLGVFVTSFLAGWLIGGSILLGVLFAGSWLMLPWLEILTRIRKLRLPIERTLESTAPPSRGDFPSLSELTDTIEEAEFEHLGDFAWETESQKQFYRFFYHDVTRTEAVICLVEQEDVSFFFSSVTSRTAAGGVYMTWNYPFSYGLRLLPSLRLRRVESEVPFADMLSAHHAFLQESGISGSEVESQTMESIRRHVESDLKCQIAHNLDLGLLCLVGVDKIRYSTRGMFFLWFQFLRDFVRLS